MLSRIKDLKKDDLVRGSFILFVMIGIYNLLNYIFQMSMARFLGPGDYSILAVLMSIVYVFSIPSESIQTVITKYASVFNTQKKYGKIKDLLLRSIRKGSYFALIIFIIYVLISFFVAEFLNIDVWLIIITGLFIFIVFLLPVTRGVLQGRKKFTSLGLNLVLESLIKVILSVVLVLIGWKAYGAITGVIMGTFLAFLFSFFSIRDITKIKRERAEFQKIYRTNLPILVATLSIVLMYSIDTILARRFFSPEIAGQFAFVSLIGKVIIFASSSIGKAMFPIATEEFERGNRTSGLLKKSILIVALLSLISLILYYTLPTFIISILSLGSTQYLGAAHILFILGLAYSLISISNIIILYKLSVGKINKSSAVLLIFVVIEVILLSVFNKNLVEYSMSLLLSSVLMFLYSIFLIKK